MVVFFLLYFLIVVTKQTKTNLP